jgi:hypothetical protein
MVRRASSPVQIVAGLRAKRFLLSRVGTMIDEAAAARAR